MLRGPPVIEPLDLLAELEWSGWNWPNHDDPHPACPCCGGFQNTEDVRGAIDYAVRSTLAIVRAAGGDVENDLRIGHRPGCRLAALLRSRP